ncbi:hypothetical protein O1611_g5081 [Lasiodiplodia mahajangana]|uniref:Uncharacterized protein n=1 Tax=Lasiodiplodia mahajangana TaxID=1108764 RepID=A0ACC2JM37_9PEZI|nr:hypothetical protein O1611_g5081 [Lasiodiplodia mahajangana]
MLVAKPALAAAGFGAEGVVGGSIAAGAQAGIGNVAAGSTFATLQSAAMGGYGASIIAGGVQAVGALAIGGAGVISAIEAMGNENRGIPDKKDEDAGEHEIIMKQTLLQNSEEDCAEGQWVNKSR